MTQEIHADEQRGPGPQAPEVRLGRIRVCAGANQEPRAAPALNSIEVLDRIVDFEPGGRGV